MKMVDLSPTLRIRVSVGEEARRGGGKPHVKGKSSKGSMMSSQRKRIEILQERMTGANQEGLVRKTYSRRGISDQ